MAAKDDTSKPRHSRRNQPRSPAATRRAATLVTAELPPEIPPRTLEEAVEDARTLILHVRAVLHCLSDVLLYADDDDSVMHAEVARSTAGWANLAAEKLDRVNLRPLIEAIRQRGGGEPDEGGSESGCQQSYQVREPRALYLV